MHSLAVPTLHFNCGGKERVAVPCSPKTSLTFTDLHFILTARRRWPVFGAFPKINAKHELIGSAMPACMFHRGNSGNCCISFHEFLFMVYLWTVPEAQTMKFRMAQ
jgi:hypothetical protein